MGLIPNLVFTLIYTALLPFGPFFSLRVKRYEKAGGGVLLMPLVNLCRRLMLKRSDPRKKSFNGCLFGRTQSEQRIIEQPESGRNLHHTSARGDLLRLRKGGNTLKPRGRLKR